MTVCIPLADPVQQLYSLWKFIYCKKNTLKNVVSLHAMWQQRLGLIIILIRKNQDWYAFRLDVISTQAYQQVQYISTIHPGVTLSPTRRSKWKYILLFAVGVAHCSIKKNQYCVWSYCDNYGSAWSTFHRNRPM